MELNRDDGRKPFRGWFKWWTTEVCACVQYVEGDASYFDAREQAARGSGVSSQSLVPQQVQVPGTPNRRRRRR